MADLFDPEIISTLKGLEVRSQRLVASHMMGMHKSSLRGISTEFAQHRQYVVGDDTRHVDWKVYAKTDEVFIKEYEAETNMAVYFMIDMSPSMFYKSEGTPMSKFEYAATIVATLCYMMQQQKDLFGLCLFDANIQKFMKPKGSNLHYRNMISVLEDELNKEIDPSDDRKTDIGNTIKKLGPQVKSKGIVVVISDFVDDIEKLGLGLGQISFLGQDSILFHIEDPVERDFPFAGQTIFRGLEGEGKLLCDPRDLRSIYLEKKAEHLDKLQDICVKFGYDFRRIQTDTRLDVVLSEFMSTRMSQRRRRR